MLMRLSVLGGGEPIQWLVSPAVYLDHWAVLDFIAEADLARRFADALERLGGTLVLSWASVAEFCKARTDEQARAAEVFIELNLPRLFFLSPDPFVMRDRDDGRPAPADDDLLRGFAKLRPSPGREFTASGLLSQVREQLLEMMERLTGIFVERVGSLRAEYLEAGATSAVVVEDLADQKPAQNFAQLADEIPKDSGTRLIVKELLRDYMAVLKRDVKVNDALDFFHTVVPVVFCDWVLLDSERLTQLDRIVERLEAGGRPIRMPRRLSNKRVSGGVKRLVDELAKM